MNEWMKIILCSITKLNKSFHVYMKLYANEIKRWFLLLLLLHENRQAGRQADIYNGTETIAPFQLESFAIYLSRVVYKNDRMLERERVYKSNLIHNKFLFRLRHSQNKCTLCVHVLWSFHRQLILVRNRFPGYKICIYA